MREIKFRAWDKQTKKMKPWWVIRRTVYNHDHELVTDPDGYGKHNDCFSDPDYIIMQYTGLKDKDGVEIYEGDVVSINAKIDYPLEYGGISIDRTYIGVAVIISSKGVCIRSPYVIEHGNKDQSWKCKHYKNIVSYRSKIIGNIYEDPELLNDLRNDD